jgi:hypothetical protein
VVVDDHSDEEDAGGGPDGRVEDLRHEVGKRRHGGPGTVMFNGRVKTRTQSSQLYFWAGPKFPKSYVRN